MSIEQLTTTLNESDLLPYEIAEAVYEHLKPSIIDNFEYGSLQTIEDKSDIMQFYLAAKHLKD